MKQLTYPAVKWGARLSLVVGLLVGLNLVYTVNCAWPHWRPRVQLVCSQGHFHLSGDVQPPWLEMALDPLGANWIKRAKASGLWDGQLASGAS